MLLKVNLVYVVPSDISKMVPLMPNERKDVLTCKKCMPIKTQEAESGTSTAPYIVNVKKQKFT